MLRMDEISKIKKEHNVNKKNPHQIAQKFNRSWATVNSYLEKTPEEIKKMGKRSGRKTTVKTDKVISRICELLKEEKAKKIKRKQRYTSAFLFRKLKDEGIYNGSERQFRSIIKEQRRHLDQPKKQELSFLELDFQLGEYIQVDHGEVEIEYNGHIVTTYLFCASVPGATLRFCQLYMFKSKESWGDFHEKMFNFFGGIFPNAIYDNDSVLIVPSTEKRTNFSIELEAHYGTKPIFCNKAAGWEKGSVENIVGFCRRNFLPGRPKINSFCEVNNQLRNKVFNHICEKRHYKTNIPLKKLFDDLHEKLFSLEAKYNWGVWVDLTVNSYQQVVYKNHRYSVPEKYVGAKVKAHISPFFVNIYHDNDLICSHQRCFIEGEDRLNLDHYLDQLERKPRAIAFARVMKKQKFPQFLINLRKRLKSRYEMQKADVEFIKILQLQRTSSKDNFELAIKLGLDYGGVSSSAIKSILMQLQTSQAPSNFSRELLPSHCHSILESSFDLGAYSCLENSGGEL